MWTWATAALIAVSCVAAEPRTLTLDDKRHFYLKAEAPVILADELMDETAFVEPLRAALNASPLMAPASLSNRLPEGIFVGTAAHPGALAKRKFKRYLQGAAGLGEEGYRIVVEKEGVVVLGGGLRGAWYGLHTLARLADQYDANLPHLDLSDGPELAVRGAYLKTIPTARDIQTLAALKCTHLFLESDDFHDLEGVRAQSWRNVFEMARDNYLEPVPVFSTLRGMEKTLRDHPMMIEGRAVTERVTLHGNEWVSLRYPNIIADHPESLSVSISGVNCVYTKDYSLEPQSLTAPFLPERPRWRIRREPGGAVPDGAQVELRYTIATEDSSSLCFAAPESRAWLRTALERLITELEPRYIHLDHGAIGRLNQDMRSLGRNLSNAEAFGQSLALMAGLVKEIDGDVDLMMWSNLLNPAQGAEIYGLAGAEIPTEILRLGRANIPSPDEAIERFGQIAPVTSQPLIMAVNGSAAAAGTVQRLMVAQGLRKGGLVALSDTPEGAEPVLNAAWSGTERGSIWPRLLNRYFDADLDHLDHDAVLSALVRHLNEETLMGNSPMELRQRFESHCGSYPDVLTADPKGYEQARALMALLTDYLLLEERFSQSGTQEGLDALRDLVAQARALDPLPDAARYAHLDERIEVRKHFLSGADIFLEDLRCFRPHRPALRPYEIPVRPVLEESPKSVNATITLMTGQAPVRRVDVEGVNLASAVLTGAHRNAPREEIRSWAGPGLAGARGAWLLPAPTVHPTLHLAFSSTGEVPAVRELRLFGEKPAAEMECGYATITPAMVATFEGRPWLPSPQGGAFLQLDQPLFAEAPTAVWVTRTRNDLYVAVEAGTFAPKAIIADLTQRDTPLAHQESVEVWLQPEGKLPLRLVASPLGTQFDSEADDAGWDGEWEVVTEKTATGWSALFRIPVALIGDPARGTNLPFNIVRNRHDDQKERSAWAWGYGAQPDLQWGMLRFP